MFNAEIDQPRLGGAKLEVDGHVSKAISLVETIKTTLNESRCHFEAGSVVHQTRATVTLRSACETDVNIVNKLDEVQLDHLQRWDACWLMERVTESSSRSLPETSLKNLGLPGIRSPQPATSQSRGAHSAGRHATWLSL